jgi:hypothetical protein
MRVGDAMLSKTSASFTLGKTEKTRYGGKLGPMDASISACDSAGAEFGVVKGDPRYL